LIRAALAIASAGLWALAMPGFGMPALAWVALVPLLLAIRGVPPAGAAALGLLCGTVFYAVHCAWLTETVSLASCAILAGASGLWIGAFAGLAQMLGRRAPSWRLLSIPSAWVVVEWLRVHAGFLGLPFGTLGHSQYEVLPVAGVAAVFGVHGVSWLLVAVNAGLAELLAPSTAGAGRRGLVRAGAAAGMLAGFVALGAAAGPAQAPDAGFRVALVQAGVHDARDPASPPAFEVARRYTSRSQALAGRGPQLVVWPASSVPYDLAADAAVRWRLTRLAGATGVPLLVGSSGRDKSVARARGWQPAANSAFLFDGGGPVSRYDKVRLLPFNEYLPLRGRVPWPAWIASASADARAGDGRTVFETGGARFGVVICWEALFASDFREAARGADFMVSMTNEAFTRSPRAHEQMLAMNVFRAIENRIAVVRPATTGISALIGPDGRILDRVVDGRGRSLDVEGDLLAGVPLGRDRAFYGRVGDWALAPLAAGLLIPALRGGRTRWRR
jgi:apolipoprotein N-acyltransferase